MGATEEKKIFHESSESIMVSHIVQNLGAYQTRLSRYPPLLSLKRNFIVLSRTNMEAWYRMCFAYACLVKLVSKSSHI